MKGITGRYIELNDVEDLLLGDEKKSFKFLKLTNTKTFHKWVVQMQYPFDQSDDDEDDDVTNKGVLPVAVAVPKDFKILALHYFPLEIKGLLTC